MSENNGAGYLGFFLAGLGIGAALAFGVMDVVSGLMPTYLSFAAVLPLVGFTALTMLTAANATMQLGIEPPMRGRTRTTRPAMISITPTAYMA